MRNERGNRCGPALCGMVLLALAVVGARTADTVRVGYWVLQSGDSQTRILRALGRPDAREALRSPSGTHVGERWYYSLRHRDGPKLVTVTLRGGRVAAISQELLPEPAAGEPGADWRIYKP